MTGHFSDSWRLLQAGDTALLVELPSLGHSLALMETLRSQQIPGIVDCIPAARSVLVCHDPSLVAQERVADWIESCMAQVVEQERDGLGGMSEAPRIEIPVDYSGADLDFLAEWLGMARKELIERHAAQDFLAAFAGFAPGFVYLSGGDPVFRNIPRRAAPRARVAAGSVAVAGDFSAVYPVDSPGGWQLLGTTRCRLWDLSRVQPALIQPGYRVRFVDQARLGLRVPVAKATGGDVPRVLSAVRDPGDGPVPAEDPGQGPGAAEVACALTGTGRFTVRSVGVQTLAQDVGRIALSRIGVSRSGALDQEAMAHANGLVGNPGGAVVLENALGGLILQAHTSAVVAVAGATATIRLESGSGKRHPAGLDMPLSMQAGDVLQLGPVRAGMRCYVAVRGGWRFDAVLGSQSTDTLSGLGPAPLRPGDDLHVGGQKRSADHKGPVPEAFGVPRWPRLRGHPGRWGQSRNGHWPQAGQVVWVRIMAGPRDDWFTPEALEYLVTQEWRVTAQSNRIALQLEGAVPLRRRHVCELPSEGVVTGAIQVPAHGQPVVFLADHPLTGGYPVAAVVRSADLGRLAQIPPGVRLRFTWHHNPSRNSL